MRPHPRYQIFLPVVICLLVPALLPAQTGAKVPKPQTDAQKAEAAFIEAIALHREFKYEEALAKVKEGLKLAPKNTRLDSYRIDLEELAGDDLERHALAAPPEAEASIEALARYLTKDAKDDRAKARAIYRWVADRIAFDTARFLSGEFGDSNAENVLKTRCGMCDGYSSLYEALAKSAGLEVAIVKGLSKDIGTPAGGKSKDGHVWNAVKLDGKWQLLDTTWGAGAVEGKAWVKQYNPHRFLEAPDQFAFTHFPDDAKWQLLPTAVTAEDFARSPKISAVLFEAGVSAAAVRATVKDGRELAEFFPIYGPHVKLVEAPLERNLRAGTKYQFRIEAPSYVAVAADANGKVQQFVRKGDVFEGVVTAAKGELKISVRPSSAALAINYVCRYRVE